MPDISAAGTYTKATAGFAGLEATPANRAFMFAGSSLGDSCVVKYIDDTGTAQLLENGTVTALPYAFKETANLDFVVVVTGSPDFNLTITS